MGAAAKGNKGPSASGEPSKVYWDNTFWLLRFTISVITGCVLGFLAVRGIAGFAVFAAVQVLAGHVFLAYSGVPDYVLDTYDTYTDHVLVAFTTFVVSWIIAYSTFNF
ncbi:hypothetical protein BgAZ_103600 [Babesia gibsoni]|uniref:Rab5-interacting protein n=1 Tax=Babesia gibsoni TaxID=33632 RepID=A0AAD8PFQ7_BABGI|nr:hypothetical protein BgAZ_103600 [Babesia gibsoni]